MKLVKFERQGRAGQGVLEGDRIVLIGDWVEGPAAAAPFTLPSLGLSGLREALASSSDSVSLSEVVLACPAGRTSKVICLGVNYRDHAAEVGQDSGDCPPLFAKYPDALVGHESPIIRPKVSETFDFEGEIALVIGPGGRHIQAESALNHILGYTVLMDGSVREYQGHSPTAGKNFDRSGSMGPWIVTADEAPEIAKMNLETRLNGKVVQHAVATDMIFSIPVAIAYVSRWIELVPGDVISMGTPAGVGWARKPPLWMKPGDVIEVSVSGVGVLRNPVEAE